MLERLIFEVRELERLVREVPLGWPVRREDVPRGGSTGGSSSPMGLSSSTFHS